MTALNICRNKLKKTKFVKEKLNFRNERGFYACLNRLQLKISE